jgi:hypothetical protein
LKNSKGSFNKEGSKWKKNKKNALKIWRLKTKKENGNTSRKEWKRRQN